jgi:hypothetical protein
MSLSRRTDCEQIPIFPSRPELVSSEGIAKAFRDVSAFEDGRLGSTSKRGNCSTEMALGAISPSRPRGST